MLSPGARDAGGRAKLAIISHKFQYLRPKSGHEMLIDQFDQVTRYNTFHARDFLTQTKMSASDDFIR